MDNNKMKSLQIVLALVLIFTILTINNIKAEDRDLSAIFNDRGVTGTLILSTLDSEIEYIHNDSRSTKRYLPASTFKLPHTLIALNEGAITDSEEVIKWDGKDRGYSLWNKDQTLRSALPASCVWFYQELAKRLDNQTYLNHLERLDYGNKKTGPEITTFWLDGDIKISAREQIDFVKKLYREELPYPRKDQKLVKELMLITETPSYSLYAKTGWAMRKTNQHGWYIGYVETPSNVWFFATNIDIINKKDSKYRKEIVIESLKAKGIIADNGSIGQ